MLRSERQDDIPELTKLVARAAFPEGSVVMTKRDELGLIFEGDEFAGLYPKPGRPARGAEDVVGGHVTIILLSQHAQHLPNLPQMMRCMDDNRHCPTETAVVVP